MKFKLLSAQPGIGRVRDDLMPELQSFPFERYVIFYRKVSGGIEIIRVLHSARDVGAQFQHGSSWMCNARGRELLRCRQAWMGSAVGTVALEHR